MYNYFRGKIIDVNATSIVVDVNNIGYEIVVPNPFTYQEGIEELIYTYLHVREDIMCLYGFKNTIDKNFFMKLLSVKGIGPKSALAILACGNVGEISAAIDAGDDVRLTKFPGIGPKAAKQIILDLKGKIVLVEKEKTDDYDDVIEALLALGYKRKEIEKHIKKLDAGLSESEAIKIILQQI